MRGLAHQLLFLAWIVASRNYGLLPMTLALTFTYARAHLSKRHST